MTKANPKVEDNDDTRLVFSDPTFTVAAAPTTEQACLVSAATFTTTSTIPDDRIIKDIFAAEGDWMQSPNDPAPRSKDIIIVEITKSQVSMLAKKGATIVDQGGNYKSYCVDALPPCAL